MNTVKDQVLKQELDTYNNKRDELLGSHKGQYVLIKGETILGIFTSEEDAINQGYRELGNIPFLVKKILEIEETINYMSNYLCV